MQKKKQFPFACAYVAKNLSEIKLKYMHILKNNGYASDKELFPLKELLFSSDTDAG